VGPAPASGWGGWVGVPGRGVATGHGHPSGLRGRGMMGIDGWWMGSGRGCFCDNQVAGVLLDEDRVLFDSRPFQVGGRHWGWGRKGARAGGVGVVDLTHARSTAARSSSLPPQLRRQFVDQGESSLAKTLGPTTRVPCLQIISLSFLRERMLLQTFGATSHPLSSARAL
jgi:hypothetical protein